jgi:uncharacterized membrane protein (UPF0127 family)
MKVIHKKTNKILSNDLKIAKTLVDRTIGLMFVKEMKGFDALLLDPCNSVHNFFVRFPIDLIFLDDELKIVKLKKCFKPWRMTGIYFKARKVLELPNGTITSDISEGDYLEVRHV